MRVLVIAKQVDRTEAALLLRLVHSDIDIHVLHDMGHASAQRIRESGIPADHVDFRSRIDFRAIVKLRKVLREGAFDLVHTLTNRALANALLASIGLPVSHVTYRGTLGHVPRLSPASWLAHLNPRIDRIICASNAVGDYLAGQGVPRHRLTTIYKGHDPSWYRDVPRVRLPDLGVPADAFVVGFVGRIRPVKGVDVLCQSLRYLADAPQVHLLLVGDLADPRVKRLLDRPELAGRIHCTGFREDAIALMRLCHVFVLPSLRREGLCRAVVEAMCQGVPPIVTRVGGMPELVIDGECGLVVPPTDAEALAAAIRRLVDTPDLREKFGAAAARRITTDFTVDAYVEQTRALYRSVIQA